MRCSERTLFRLYKDLRFPMLQWPRSYAKFGARGVWWTSELMIRNWFLAVCDAQRQIKLRGNPWWAKLEEGHKLIVPEGLRTAETPEENPPTRG